MRQGPQDGWVGKVQLAIAIAGAVFLVLPLFVVFPMAFSSSQRLEFPPPGYSLDLFRGLFASTAWMSSIATSFKVATMASLLAMLLGVPASYAIVRRKFLGRGLLYALLLTPLVVPVIIIALSLFLAFGPLRLVGNIYALAVGHALLGVPFVVVMTTAVLRDFDIRLEHAARSLGAGPLQSFLFVTFPSIASGIFVGALTAFAISFDEVVMALIIGGRSSNTLPRQIWSGLVTQVDPVVPAVSALLIGAVLSALALVWTRQAFAGRAGRRRKAKPAPSASGLAATEAPR